MVNEPDEVKPKAYSGETAEDKSPGFQSRASDLPNGPHSGSGTESSLRKDDPDDSTKPDPQVTEKAEPADSAEAEPSSPKDLPPPHNPSEDVAETQDAGSQDDLQTDPAASAEQYQDTYQAEAAYSDPSSEPESEPGEDPQPEAAAGVESAPASGRKVRSEPVEDMSSEEEEEDGGGPVKTFLEHLEDLRWVIIRCLAALVIAMVVCLVAGNKIVDLLKDPLLRAQQLTPRKSKAFVLLELGTNKVVLNLETNVFGPYSLAQTNAIKLVVAPVPVGSNMFLGLVPATLDPEEVPPVNQIELKNLGPVSPFVVALKIALFGGIGLASPFLLLFIGQFVVPALRRKEKKYLYRAVAIGTGLFCAGVLFCYFFMLQIALNAAVKFSAWMGFGADIWRAEDYIGFVVKFLLGMGLSFELPVVLLTLVKLELLDYARMNKFRPLWVVVNLGLAALLTPPDVVSQLLMAIPLQLLFELSVLIAWYWHRRDQKRAAAEGLAG